MDRDETLAVLKQAQALGLLPGGWWVYEDGASGAVRLGRGDWFLVAVWDHSRTWPDDDAWQDGRELVPGVQLALLDHLAGLGWTVKRLPAGTPPACQWAVQRLGPEGSYWFGSFEPGILGLLAAAVAAETWRRAQEVTP